MLSAHQGQVMMQLPEPTFQTHQMCSSSLGLGLLELFHLFLHRTLLSDPFNDSTTKSSRYILVNLSPFFWFTWWSYERRKFSPKHNLLQKIETNRKCHHKKKKEITEMIWSHLTFINVYLLKRCFQDQKKNRKNAWITNLAFPPCGLNQVGLSSG